MVLDGDLPAYRLFLPKQAVGLSLVYFDLFNASGSGVTLLVASVIPIVSGAVAVTGVVGLDLLLTRTTAVGTTGTAATNEGTDTTAATFSAMGSKGQALPAEVTARLAPGGGATAGAVIGWCAVSTEEATGTVPSPSTYLAHTNDLVRRFQPDCPPLQVTPGTGIRVVQGAVASVGNLGFDILFFLKKR